MKMISRLALSSTLARGIHAVASYDNPPPEPKQPAWKMDGDKIALQDGKPVFVDANGGENPFDLSSLARLNSEAAGHRRTARENADKLKAFEGIDAAAAREALQKVADMGDKDMIDRGEVDKVRNAVATEWEKKHSPVVEENKGLKSKIEALVTDNAFANSTFLRDKIAVPLDMIKATFAKHFQYDGETLVPHDAKGEKMFSVKNPGGVPDFEEAIEMLISGYAHKDQILKGTNHNGNGGGGNGGNGGQGKRVLRRADFDKLTPTEQLEFSKLVGEGKAQLIAN